MAAKYGRRATQFRNISWEVQWKRYSSYKSHHFDHIRFTGHTTNTVRRRPTSGNQNGDQKPEVRYISGLD